MNLAQNSTKGNRTAIPSRGFQSDIDFYCRFLREVWEQMGYQGNTEPLCNYFFMSTSTVVITAIVYWITQKWLLPTLGKYEGSVKVVAYHPLSRKERRAIMISIVVAAVYVALILWLTFSSYGILRGVNGGLMHSPFIAGILFLLSLGAGITEMVYGFSSGRYRTDNDVIEGLLNNNRKKHCKMLLKDLPLL